MNIGRIVIIGAGAVGAGTAAELALRDRPHLLVGRGEQIRHLTERGLKYRRPEGVRQVQLSTCDGISNVQLRAGDVLVIATKTQHVAQVAEQLAWQPVEGGSTASELPVLTLQNGMASEPILLRYFAHVYGGSILIPASYTTTGEVISGAAPKIASFVMGRAPRGLDETAQEIAEHLREIDWLVQLDENVIRWKALKLLHSVKNGLELLDLSKEHSQQLGHALVHEAKETLSAAAIPVAENSERTEDMSLFQVDSSSGYQPGQQSTWQSYARGASPEVDYLNGEIVQLGRLHAVPTPVNAALQRVLGVAWLQRQTPGQIDAGPVLAALPKTDFDAV